VIKMDEVSKTLKRFTDDFFIFAIRRMTSVKRYNTTAFIREQNIAEHHGNVTFMAMVISDYFNQVGIKNNTERVMRLAIMHDLAEVVSSDLPHHAKYDYGKISEELRKSLTELEKYSMIEILERLKNKELEKKYYQQFDEEKDKKTLESKIVKLADYLDVVAYGSIEYSLGNKQMGIELKNAKKKFGILLNDVLSNYKS